MMRILLAHNHYQNPGGEDIVFASEGALLRQREHEVVEYLEDNRHIGGMGRGAVAIQTIWSRSSRQRLLRLLRETRPNVAHFHNTFLLISPSAYSACREAGVPVVQTLHNYRLLCPTATFFRDGSVCQDCLGKTPTWPGVLHACYQDSRAKTAAVASMLTLHRWLRTWQNQVDAYIALTEFARGKFIEGGLPEEKIVVKPNFVYPDPGQREKPGDFFLFVGRLSHEKGVRTLLEAWTSLARVPLKIIGDGPLRVDIEQWLQLRPSTNVEILGRLERSQVLMLIKKCRALVFPSEWYESFPLTLAEALACGVPAIVSRLGAMEENIDDGKTGFHYNPGDPEDLAAKIEVAWKDPERVHRMGQECRRDYEAKYTAERNYSMLTDIYERAIASQA